MKAEDIKKIVLSDLIKESANRKDSENIEVSMLPNEIPGATVFYHIIKEGTTKTFPVSDICIRILFLCSGDMVFEQEGQRYCYNEKVVFVGNPESVVNIKSNCESHLLEIQWKLSPTEYEEFDTYDTKFPIICQYKQAIQYRDPFKSEKTISRAIIPQRTIPRFAMGSVETYGDDLIGQHEHPLLDQFFFSFPENNMDLLLDDLVYPLGGDTLLHIPLGSNHGVSVKGNQCAHYIWIDFIVNEEGNNYLDKVHKETGTLREF